MRSASLEPPDFGNHGPRSGQSALELMAVVVIVMVLFGAANSGIVSLQGALAQSTVQTNMDEAGRRTLDRITSALRAADARTVVLSSPQDAAGVTFASIEGWDAAGPLVGPVHSINFAVEKVFMDGTVVSENVKSLVFDLEERTLTISLEIEAPVPDTEDGSKFSRTFVSQLRL